jgi:hypothetical protein
MCPTQAHVTLGYFQIQKTIFWYLIGLPLGEEPDRPNDDCPEKGSFQVYHSIHEGAQGKRQRLIFMQLPQRT